MYPYPKVKSPIGAATLYIFLCVLLSSCNTASVADEVCSDSQDFSLSSELVDDGTEDGISPDIRLSVFTLDSASGCITPMLDGQCTGGSCEQRLVAVTPRQQLFLRVVSSDPGGVRNLHIGLNGGFFAEDGDASDEIWIDLDYRLNSSVANLFSDAPQDGIFFQDAFEMSSAQEEMTIVVTASDFGQPGSDPLTSVLGVTVSHGDLTTSAP